MVFAHNAFQNVDIFGIAYLNQKISTSLLYIAFQYVITVFCHPNKVNTQPTYCM